MAIYFFTKFRGTQDVRALSFFFFFLTVNNQPINQSSGDKKRNRSAPTHTLQVKKYTNSFHLFDHDVRGTYLNLDGGIFSLAKNENRHFVSYHVGEENVFPPFLIKSSHTSETPPTLDSGTFSSLSVLATSCFRTPALRRRSTNGASMPLTSRTFVRT